MFKMFRPRKIQLCLSKQLLDPVLRRGRGYSVIETNGRTNARNFPFAMLNIMNHGKRLLISEEEYDEHSWNCVRIEDNGLINPDVPKSGEGS